MSLALTALRLCVIEALNEDVTLAGLLQGRVYDSRIGNLDVTEACPLAMVTVDEASGEAFSKNNGGPPFDLAATITVELKMVAIERDGGGAMVAGVPYTDRELEAQLDALAHRVVEVAGAGEGPWARRLRRDVTRRIMKLQQSRYETDETGQREASRLVTLTVSVKDSAEPFPHTAPGEFGVLPDPLRTVCEAATRGSSAAATCALLAGLYAAPANDPFEGIDATMRPVLDLAEPGAGDPTAPRPAVSFIADLEQAP